ncbi:MAG: YIP1 family protein [Ignavibacteriaceae bacterium]
MKNYIICGNCKTENLFYQLTCENCGAYIRDRVNNIDLWNILGLIIENPRKAFKIIINSEHKNFVFVILFFASIKFYIDSIFISLLSPESKTVHTNIFLDYSFIFIQVFLIIVILSFLFSLIEKSLGLITRSKDNFAIITYSLVPHFFAAIIIFPIELILFGEYLFSTNPSPFELKGTLAYTLLVFETLIIIWSFFLLTIGFIAKSKNIFYSVSSSLLISLIIFSSLYLTTKLIFS